MLKVAVVVPLYHANELHFDFTKQTVESVNFPDNIQGKIFLINNYSLPQFEPNLDSFRTRYPQVIIKNPKGNHVGASWNLGIKMALEEGYDYVIVCNNDIIFHKNCIGNLVDFANKHQNYILWTAAEWPDLRTIKTVDDAVFDDNFDEHPHFSCFMVSKNTVDLLQGKEKDTKEPLPGYFDEGFDPSYFEDQDMAHRIYRAGYKAIKVSKARFYHYGSRTISVDDGIYALNRRTYEQCREYFKKKWNYDPHSYCPAKEEDRLTLSYKNAFNS